MSSTVAPNAVAPASHTGVLIVMFLGLALAGAAFQHAAGAGSGPAAGPTRLEPIYLSLLLMEWGLAYYVWQAGLRRRGKTLLDLVGGKWASWTDVARDLALAVALWALAGFVLMGMDRLIGQGHAASIRGFMPRRPTEVTLWLTLSLSAGFVEELVFRGYFQRQFEAWTRSPSIALLLQALLFGVSHGYQGVMACTKIAVYGALFGAVALWRRSLRPGMLAHALTDIVAGIF